MTIDATVGWQKTKYIRDRDNRAKMREKAIYERYYLNGESLKVVSKDLGMSVSGAEKVINRNKWQKRKDTGTALDDIWVASSYNSEKWFVEVFTTGKQLENAGFKWALARNSLVNQTYTRKAPRRKNGVKWYFELLKDFDLQKISDIDERRKLLMMKIRQKRI